MSNIINICIIQLVEWLTGEQEFKLMSRTDSKYTENRYQDINLSQRKPSLEDLKQFFQSSSHHFYANQKHQSIFRFVQDTCYRLYSNQHQCTFDLAINQQYITGLIITSSTVQNYANLKSIIEQELDQRQDYFLLKAIKDKNYFGLPKAIAARSFIKADYGIEYYHQYIRVNNLELLVNQKHKNSRMYAYFCNTFIMNAYRSAETYMRDRFDIKFKASNEVLKHMCKFLRNCRSYLDEANCKTFLLLIIQNFKFGKVQFKKDQIQKFYFSLEPLRRQVSKYMGQIQKTNRENEFFVFSKSKYYQIFKETKQMSLNCINHFDHEDNQNDPVQWNKQLDELLIQIYFRRKEIAHLTSEMSKILPDLNINQKIIQNRLNYIQIQNLHLIKQMSKQQQNDLPKMVDLTDKVINKFRSLSPTNHIRLGLSYFKVNCDLKLVKNLILGINHIVFQK